MTKEESVEGKIRNWLLRHGLPFELKVGRQIQEAGWSVSHATYFTDVRTKKVRELDIRATPKPRNRGFPSFWLSLAIQCKQSGGKPWVVFSSASEIFESRFPSAFVSGKVASELLFEYDVRTKSHLSVVDVGKKRGHGIVRVKFGQERPDRVDAAYNALRSASAAAAALAIEEDKRARDDGLEAVGLFFPVVVTNGPIYTFALDPSGEEHLTEVEEACVLTPEPTTASGRAIVNVVTPNALKAFLARAEGDAEKYNFELSENRSAVLEAVGHRLSQKGFPV